MAVITFTTQPVEVPTSATPTFYQKVSGDLIAALDAFVSTIPKVEEAEVVDAKQVRKNLNVSEAFCYAAISAAEQLPELEGVRKMYAEKDRSRLQYIEAFRPLYAKVIAVGNVLQHGLRANRSAVGGDALEIYRFTTGARKNSRNPALFTFHATMKVALAKRGGPTKAEREAAAKKKFDAAVEQEVLVRLAKFGVAPQPKAEEVIAA